MELLAVFGDAIYAVLDTVNDDKCFPLIITDDYTSSATINRLRQRWKCLAVIVVSEDPDFLSLFAQWSLQERLLIWYTRLIVLTRLPKDDINMLFASHWTYAMTNAVVLNAHLSTLRCDVYCLVPYSVNGRQVIKLATWINTTGLEQLTDINIFHEKYTNFYGMMVNVTALPYEPYWMTSQNNDNTTQYSGIDYQQLVTLSQSLNFTFHVLHSDNWQQVTDQVESRTSFLASIVYVILPNRLLRWDYTDSFDYSPLTFAMAKPSIAPSWVSCYYPFSHGVWGAVIASTILTSIALIKMTRMDMWTRQHGELSTGTVVMEVISSLLGQGLRSQLSMRRSNHLLVGAWLSVGMVVGTAYNSSLIASLTLPRLPETPQTLHQLVKAIDRATMESFGISYRNSFLASENSVFRDLGNLIQLDVTVVDGLTRALTKKEAHIGGHQNLELTVAQYFTEANGQNPLYVAKGIITPSMTAWPIPHDAPYKHNFDNVIRSITESGLYDFWRKVEVQEAKRKGRLRKRKIMSEGIEEVEEDKEDKSNINSLTITHIQGPLMLLCIGLFLGGFAFLMERCGPIF